MIYGLCGFWHFPFLAVGSYVPIANVRDDVAAAYKLEVEWQTNEMLIPYRNMVSRKQVTRFFPHCFILIF